MSVTQILAASCFVSALAALFCAWRVYVQGLAELYPAFFSYLLLQGILLVVTSIAGVGSSFFLWAFIVAYPITWVVDYFIVRELYNSIFRDYPGIAMFGRWSAYVAFSLAGVIALASRLATREALHKKSVILVPLETAGRDIVWGLALCLIVLLILISRYPVKLHRNVLINCSFFSALLLGEAFEMLANHVSNFNYTLQLDISLMVFNIGCFTVWGLLLSTQGAIAVIQVRHRFSGDDEKRLLAQLTYMNTLATRAGRK